MAFVTGASPIGIVTPSSFDCQKALPLQFNEKIPTVNLKSLLSHNEEERKKAIATIAQAIRSIGFFAVVDNELNPKAIADGYKASKLFFRQEMKVKAGVDAVNTHKNNGQRGWVLGEVAQNAPKKDWKEFYHIGPENKPEGSADVFVENIWPEENVLSHESFKNPMNRLYDHLREKSFIIAKALLDAVDPDLDRGVKESMMKSLEESPNMLMRALHYKSNPPDGEPWAFQHVDTGFFTILPRAEEPGLQVKVGEKWVPVDVPEGAYIVNLGDHFENWTNGECKAALHRVVAPDNESERDSIVFFVHGTSNTSYTPLQSCIDRTAGVQLYPDLTQRQLLFARLYELGISSEYIGPILQKEKVVEALAQYGRASEKLQTLLPKKSSEIEIHRIS